MLPGTLCDGQLFAPVLDRLGITAKVPALGGADTASALARSILAEAPPTVSLVGFSLGAIVALEIVAQAPRRVARLALIGCNSAALDVEARSRRAALDKSSFLAGEAMPVLHRMAEATSDEAYRQQTAITLSRADSRSRLGQIAVPTLVLCGANDAVCPSAMSREIAARIRHSRLAIIPDAGHHVLLEKPVAVAAELSAWLATPSHSHD